MAEKFYCEYCGVSKSSVQSLLSQHCSKNPDGKKHKLYEGGEKSKYTCKYCGVSKSSVQSLVSQHCSKNQNGTKKHSPAL